jgi:hypothetical protein
VIFARSSKADGPHVMHPVWIIKQLAISVTSCFKTPTFHFGVAEEEAIAQGIRESPLAHVQRAFYLQTIEGVTYPKFLWHA